MNTFVDNSTARDHVDALVAAAAAARQAKQARRARRVHRSRSAHAFPGKHRSEE